MKLCTACATCNLMYNAAEPGIECRVCGGTIKIDIFQSYEQRLEQVRSDERITQLLDEMRGAGETR